MRKIGVLLLSGMVLLAVSCKSQDVQKEKQNREQMTAVKSSEIEGEWELTSIHSLQLTDETLVDLFPEKTPFLVVDLQEMTIYGNNGCNAYRGPLQSIEANKFVLGKGLASTLKYCAGVKPMVYMQALGQVKTYTIEQDILTLQSEDQSTILKYKRLNNEK